jgi:Tfp pilus assembly protein PilZ
MTRFLIIASLLFNVCLGWCAAQVFTASAHSGTDIRGSMMTLKFYDKDKNSPEYMEWLTHTEEFLQKKNSQRSSIYSSYAVIITLMAMVQFFVTLWLAGGRAFARPARSDAGGSPAPPRS